MRLRVRAPATAANLGPGFDCFGLALGLANEFVLDAEAAPGVEVRGEGAGELPADGSNLVVTALERVAREAGRGGDVPPFRLVCENGIPLARGLGSSASAVAAGVLLADRLLGLGMDPAALLEAAVAVEGHPDNVAACLRGGLVLVYRAAAPGSGPGTAGWRAESLSPHPDLRPVALVPEGERLSTDEARRVLPATVPFEDAVFNASRAALAVAALTRDPGLLAEALQDRLHQPHRLPLVPGARALFERLRAEAIPVCVSGSGPTLLAFESPGRPVPDPGAGWRALRPGVSLDGATVEEV